MNTDELAIALGNFWKRKDANPRSERIDNASLPAGSSMYFYCRHCGVPTETLPENYTRRPITICRPCDELERLGAIPTERPEPAEAATS